MNVPIGIQRVLVFYMTILKQHLHVHDFCSRNGTQCVVARRAISVVRCVLRPVRALYTHQLCTVHAMREQNDCN